MKDRRFIHPFWETHPFFAGLRIQYEAMERYYGQLLSHFPSLEKEHLLFYHQQLWASLCPANYPWLNPEVWERTLQTRGQNWIQSLANLAKSVDHHGFRMLLSDHTAWGVGQTLAVSEGVVLLRTPLFELLYYPSRRAKTLTPILMIPSWMNKFYVLDLQPENSLVGWLTAQGVPVLMISWINPQKNLGVGLQAYIQAVLRAFALTVRLFVCSPHVLGYCAGGILATYMAAYLGCKSGPQPKSLTTLNCLFNFSRLGSLRILVERWQDQSRHRKRPDILPGRLIRDLFLQLRPRDCLWPFLINHYYLGKKGCTLPIFYWNDDPMNVSSTLQEDCIAFFIRKNALLTQMPVMVDGVPLTTQSVDCPVFFLGCLMDHICPWEASYDGMRLFPGPCEFLLAKSGHIAGVINPPEANKYGYFSCGPKIEQGIDALQWKKKASFIPGSWWPYWLDWLKQYGAETDPFSPNPSLPCLGITPGTYVLQRS